MGSTHLSRKRICPECGILRDVPILYGFPFPEMFEKIEKGVIVAGGCVTEKNAPEWACTACGFRRSQTGWSSGVTFSLLRGLV